MSIARIEDAKKVETKDLSGVVNGWLFELFKDTNKTIAYLTSLKKGAFKGYHLHRIRAARYVCIKGKTKIILQRPGTTEKEEYVLDSSCPQRLFIPTNVATGLEHVGEEDEAWLINYPDPAYDPVLVNEQVEYTEEDLAKGIVK